MKAKKITERKFAVPMLALIIPVMNEAAELGFSLSMMVLVAVIALTYALLETIKDIVVIICAAKYGRKCAACLAPASGEVQLTIGKTVATKSAPAMVISTPPDNPPAQ